MEQLLTHPFFATFIGWLAWNVYYFSKEKDTYDVQKKAFPLKEYVAYTWDNWLKSLVFIPVLLIIGRFGFGFNPLEGDGELHWNHLYYLCAGPAPEFLIDLLEKYKIKKTQ